MRKLFISTGSRPEAWSKSFLIIILKGESLVLIWGWLLSAYLFCPSLEETTDCWAMCLTSMKIIIRYHPNVWPSAKQQVTELLPKLYHEFWVSLSCLASFQLLSHLFLIPLGHIHLQCLQKILFKRLWHYGNVLYSVWACTPGGNRKPKKMQAELLSVANI